MDAKAIWNGKMSFEGSVPSGLRLPMDTSIEGGGENNGFRPMELLLVGMAGCTAMDVISILQKKRQDVTGFEVRLHGDRTTEHPKVFTDINVEYIVTGINLDQVAVERAVELSEEKYCSAQAMLNKVARITHKITLIEG
jgi:putative redox protein